jgi:hypothetical protein
MSGSFSMFLDHEAPMWDQLLSSESHHSGMDRGCHDNSCIWRCGSSMQTLVYLGSSHFATTFTIYIVFLVDV